MKAKDHIKVGSAAFHPGRFVYTRRLLSEPRWVLGFIWALQKLEESDRRAQHTMDQLQREQRYLRRRLEQLGVERTRTDSTGSNLSSEKSDSDQGGLSERMRGGRGRGGGVDASLRLQPPGHLLHLAAEADLLVGRRGTCSKN